MPQYICKLPNDNFLLWSTVVDAPVTYGLPREEFDDFMQDEHGRQYMEKDHPDRMARAEKFGTSALGRPTSFSDIIVCNRAGPNETPLSMEEIMAEYGDAPSDSAPSDA